MANPHVLPARFRQRHAKCMRLINLLRNIRPGRSIQIRSRFDSVADLSGTIVKITTKGVRYATSPQSYSIRVVWPGRSTSEQISLQRLVQIPSSDLLFGDGLEHGPNQMHLREFSRQCSIVRQSPVQVLTGNHLAAITEAKRHKLGAMSLFRDATGQVHRGIVVDRSKRDLSVLPVIVPSRHVAETLAIEAMEGRAGTSTVVIWTGRRDEAVFRFSFRSATSNLPGEIYLEARAFQKDTCKFYADVPQLYEALFETPIPTTRHWRRSMRRKLLWPRDNTRILAILRLLDGVTLQTDGRNRELVNRIVSDLQSGNREPLAA